MNKHPAYKPGPFYKIVGLTTTLQSQRDSFKPFGRKTKKKKLADIEICQVKM